eukprot:gnl/MRDRNA2_/MRDRNA2_84921_c0_seq3.p1 gnl/MRDRNA2_/MRDRNA2_84921_c0~~gnl/MRDRNA2_/MRDRNA2_84921_c0_seq3.p1  ORF type:complete len:232 (+),score=36.04 gnl/MRDRNA2_/MRDRNA2_84921_c0_seq3:102-797(+)
MNYGSSLDRLPVAHGAWSFQLGPTTMTYEGGFILLQHEKGEKRLKHGEGKLRWQDGREYEGEFLYDQMHGKGVMTWPTGAKYVGEYCENYKGGIGKLTLPDGSTFDGSWFKGMRHGEILYIDPDGSAFQMEYDMDQVVSSESIPEFDGWTLKPGYHVFTQSKEQKTSQDKEAQSSEPTCCICLCDMSVGETCCKMPCNHVFHKECIDNWARRKNQCPLCMQKIPLQRVYNC